MSASKPTIFIVDDEQEVTDSLRWLLESVKYKVETYSSVEDYLQRFDANQRGCLILDIRMPGMSGLELQERLKKQNVKIPIIFITAHGDIPMTVRAMKSGALDFLTKPVNNQLLLETIYKAIKVDDDYRRDEEKNAIMQARKQSLTIREREVMQLIIKGKLSKEIAHLLSISIKTVELHRAQVMRKMEVRKIAELVNLALTYKLSE